MRPLLLSLLLAAGTAHAGEYWTPAAHHTQALLTVELPESQLNFVCSANRLDSYGCFDRTQGIIYLRAGMNPVLRKCVLSHEEKHQDFDHAEYRLPFLDCGDGTWLSAETLRDLQ